MFVGEQAFQVTGICMGVVVLFVPQIGLAHERFEALALDPLQLLPAT
jgi:hypothetical protein